MGMTDMFTNNANLTELLETVKPLKVSKAVHKAFIEVTERGTEAAAATGMFHFHFIFHCDVSKQSNNFVDL